MRTTLLVNESYVVQVDNPMPGYVSLQIDTHNGEKMPATVALNQHETVKLVDMLLRALVGVQP